MEYDLHSCTDKELESKLDVTSSRLSMAYNLGDESLIKAFQSYKQLILDEITIRGQTKKKTSTQKTKPDIISFGLDQQKSVENKIDAKPTIVRKSISIQFSQKPSSE